jgi:hypothetical protein
MQYEADASNIDDKTETYMQVAKQLTKPIKESKLQPGLRSAIGTDDAPEPLSIMATRHRHQPARGGTKIVSALRGTIPTSPVFVPAELLKAPSPQTSL